ncbi:hypothetical protein Clacol_001081 [Clathrus columnatus]|uniref:Uncharacterized protein n=1 Tax=Clathrus columnatus TaxID=1419009 RepID=A0AAV4ZYF3_9AGAM|nr:hypothetical protein Clacol_001081 [Clathrus columnatus]
MSESHSLRLLLLVSQILLFRRLHSGLAMGFSLPERAWTASYFLINGLRKEFNKLRQTPPPPPLQNLPLWKKVTVSLQTAYRYNITTPILSRLPPPLVLTLNTATAATMLLYGMEYFWFWGKREKVKRP